MELFGLSVVLIVLFVGFGFLIGILFGFFGMGGSFLVTPALLILGYPTRVAIGSGLAFVFGTSVIATLKHRSLGQVDYRLGVSMILGTAAGIEVGKQTILYLEGIGLANDVVGVAYVVLLGSIGAFVTHDALTTGSRVPGDLGEDIGAVGGQHRASGLAARLQRIKVPPMLKLRGGVTISLWIVVGIGFGTGLLSGFLGVGGGFIRMPALFYLVGVPVPIAVGTDLFEIVFSGAIGSYLYAQAGGVDLRIVVPLLSGSVVGAQLGAGATGVVDEDGIKVYFGIMLLLGALAMALKQAGLYFGMEVLYTVSFAIIVGAAVLVSGAIVYSTESARARDEHQNPPPK